MHFAIDDTYGPLDMLPSTYVTASRRTYVAVEFPDSQVDFIRNSIRSCLNEVRRSLGVTVNEFHFVDIYNRTHGWEESPQDSNLRIFEFFANIYSQYCWRVHVQTVDERTFTDHGIVAFKGTADGIDFEAPDGQSLLLLLLKIKETAPPPPEPLVVRIDAGREKPDSPFARMFFRDWQGQYDGVYASSIDEPLIQIADFLAYSINRCTHLQLKPRRTDTDSWFLELVGSMRICSTDLQRDFLPLDFAAADIDNMHLRDRQAKRLE